ncbi:hypothetical protein CEXT_461611 [Caerostris extrusa]|uniref:Uncharacterized protein n=1 Tax=Caerostris extrusa TaxID=172846 RepID=A0AAV4X6L9_CAEEX|nr:hypothetical protein CEXT_461611 [Caerostris extrusa]
MSTSILKGISFQKYQAKGVIRRFYGVIKAMLRRRLGRLDYVFARLLLVKGVIRRIYGVIKAMLRRRLRRLDYLFARLLSGCRKNGCLV